MSFNIKDTNIWHKKQKKQFINEMDFENNDIYKINKNILCLIETLKKTNKHLSHIDYDVKKIKESVGKKNEKNS